jgi:RNA recognition motif-containing protein
MNIFIGHLAPTVTSDDLRAAFGSYGNVVNAVVARDKVTKKPLGYGYVYLLPDTGARRAIQDLNRLVLRGRPIIVRACVDRTRSDRRRSNTPWNGEERRRKSDRRLNGGWTQAGGSDDPNHATHGSSGDRVTH